MHNLYIVPTPTSPEINFSVEDNTFIIKGTSSPEDVRAMYYPVTEWINDFVDNILNGTIKQYSPENPLKFRTDLMYFNSSSAKFLYDIFLHLKRLTEDGIPVIIEWLYEAEDTDMMEAGSDMSLLSGIEFIFIAKEEDQG